MFLLISRQIELFDDSCMMCKKTILIAAYQSLKSVTSKSISSVGTFIAEFFTIVLRCSTILENHPAKAFISVSRAFSGALSIELPGLSIVLVQSIHSILII